MAEQKGRIVWVAPHWRRGRFVPGHWRQIIPRKPPPIEEIDDRD